SAARAGMAVLTVDGHLVAKRRDLLRELALRLCAQTLHPLAQRRSRGIVEPHDLLVRQPQRQSHRTELRAVEDLIRIRVADSAEQAWIGERAFERAIGRAQRGAELRERRLQRFHSRRLRYLVQ